MTDKVKITNGRDQLAGAVEWTVKALIACAFFLLLFAVAFGIWVFSQNSEGEESAVSAATLTASHAAAPEGYSGAGIPLGKHSEGAREVVLVTDFSCPYCQEFYEENSAKISDLAASGEVNLYLVPVNIFPDSEVNPVAVATLQNFVASGGGQELEAYAMLSRAARASGGDLASFREQVMSGHLAEFIAVDDEASDEILNGWTKSHTKFNRDGIGVVPSVIIDGSASRMNDFTAEFLQ